MINDISTSNKIGAFFDFDGTLIRTESEAVLIRYLWRTDELSILCWLKMVISYVLFKLHLYSDERIQKMSMQAYKGKSADKFSNIGEEFYFNEIKPLLVDNIFNQLKWHQKQGHTVVMISAALRFYLKHAVKDLGIEYLLCSDLQVGQDGYLTGLPEGRLVRGQQKAILAERLASELGIDLEQSYAYGDRMADLPILQLVGYPVAVEPKPQLREVANKYNWTILQFKENNPGANT